MNLERMIRIWGRRTSSNVQKVLWLAGELALAYERVPAGGPEGRLSEPGFAELNPNRLIPVLEDDGRVVWESHAILRYLAARHGDGRWWPADPFERSLADRWLDWAATLWQPAFVGGVFWGSWRTPPQQQDPTAIARSLATCRELMAVVESMLSQRPYLAGAELSLADIAFGASLYRWFELPIDRPNAPAVEAYYERLRQRPAYRESVMVSFESLQGRLSF